MNAFLTIIVFIIIVIVINTIIINNRKKKLKSLEDEYHKEKEKDFFYKKIINNNFDSLYGEASSKKINSIGKSIKIGAGMILCLVAIFIAIFAIFPHYSFFGLLWKLIILLFLVNFLFVIIIIPVSYMISNVIYYFFFASSEKQKVKIEIKEINQKEKERIKKERLEEERIKEENQLQEKKAQDLQNHIQDSAINFLQLIILALKAVTFSETNTNETQEKKILLYSMTLGYAISTVFNKHPSFYYSANNGNFIFPNDVYDYKGKRSFWLYPVDYFFENNRVYLGYKLTSVDSNMETIIDVINNQLNPNYNKIITSINVIVELMNTHEDFDFNIEEIKFHYIKNKLYISLEENFIFNIGYSDDLRLNNFIKLFSDLFTDEYNYSPSIVDHSWLQNKALLKLVFSLPPSIGISDIKNKKEDIEKVLKKNIYSILGNNKECSIVLKIREKFEAVSINFNDMDFNKKMKIPIGKHPIMLNDIYYNYSESNFGHFFIVGCPGSGKTNWVKYFLLSIMKHFSPNEAKIILIREERDFDIFFKHESPHILCPSADSVQEIYELILRIREEIDNRKKIFKNQQSKDIQEFNINSDTKMPFWFMVFDEFASVMNNMESEFRLQSDMKIQMDTIVREGRKYGVVFIFISQKGSDIEGLKDNCRNKLCFKVENENDSDLVLNSFDAYNLENHEGLFKFGNKITHIKSPKYDRDLFAYEINLIKENSILIENNYKLLSDFTGNEHKKEKFEKKDEYGDYLLNL